MDKIVTATQHYDMLINEECDPFSYSEILKEYMKRWDGDAFYNSLNLTNEKRVLEVGVGTGRVAQNVLDMGCKSFTGIDISPKTVERAKENLLNKYNDVEVLVQNIENFCRKNYYDIVYSVLTFMHVENKEKALINISNSLKPNGNIVLSISREPDYLDYGSRKVKLFGEEQNYYIEILTKLNFKIVETIELIDTYIFPTGEKQPEYGQKIATIINARKK